MQSNSVVGQVPSKWWLNVLASVVENISDPHNPQFRELGPPPAGMCEYEDWLRSLPAPHSYVSGVPGILGVASMLVQGGMLVEFRPLGEDWLTWPLVVQALSLTGTGGGKSTAADRLRDKLLQPGLEAAGAEMKAWRHNIESVAGQVPGVADGEDWRAVVTKPTQLLLTRKHRHYVNLGPASSGTAEALRNVLIKRGSFHCLMTEEGDLLRDVSGYRQRGTAIPLEVFIKGWGREDMSVHRVGQELPSLTRIQLPVVMAVQPEIFAQATSERAFTTSGFLPRFLLTEHVQNELVGPWGVEIKDGALDPPSGLVQACEQIGRGCAQARIATVIHNAKAEREGDGDIDSPVFLGWGGWQAVDMAMAGRTVQVEMTDEDRLGLRMIYDVLTRVRPVRMFLDEVKGDGEGLLEYPAQWMLGFGSRFVNYSVRVAVLSWLLDGAPGYGWTDGEIGMVPRKYLLDAVGRVMPFLLGQWLWTMVGRVDVLERQTLVEAVRANPQMRSQDPAHNCGLVLLNAYRKGSSAAAKTNEWTAREAALEFYQVHGVSYVGENPTVITDAPDRKAMVRIERWLVRLVETGWLGCGQRTTASGGRPPRYWWLTDKAIGSRENEPPDQV